MDEIHKIVVEHFPVERLPDELRGGIEDGQTVRVTVENPHRLGATPQGSLTSFFGAGRGCYSEQEAVSFIRKLRDE